MRRDWLIPTVLTAGVLIGGGRTAENAFNMVMARFSPSEAPRAQMTPTRVTVSRTPTPGPTEAPFVRVAAFKTVPDLSGAPVQIGNDIVVRVDDHTLPNAAAVFVIAATAAGLLYLSSREQT